MLLEGTNPPLVLTKDSLHLGEIAQLQEDTVYQWEVSLRSLTSSSILVGPSETEETLILGDAAAEDRAGRGYGIDNWRSTVLTGRFPGRVSFSVLIRDL